MLPRQGTRHEVEKLTTTTSPETPWTPEPFFIGPHRIGGKITGESDVVMLGITLNGVLKARLGQQTTGTVQSGAEWRSRVRRLSIECGRSKRFAV